jgi:uncharacterized membrane protein YoaK (UPF0700 family)
MSRIGAQAVRAKGGLAFLLAWVGGFVDGVGYLLLCELFTSHQSGNSVVLGVSAGQHDWAEAVRRGFPIPVFVTGLALGAALNHVLVRRGVRSLLALPLALEACLLGLFMLFAGLAVEAGTLRVDNPVVFYPVAALPALAMGLQNSTLRRVGGLAVRTTFITGMLCGLAEEAVAYFFWFRGRQRGRSWRRVAVLLRLSPRQPHFNHVLLLGGLWLGFVVGAVSGASLVVQLDWKSISLAAPITVLAVVVLYDLLWPIASPATVRHQHGQGVI